VLSTEEEEKRDERWGRFGAWQPGRLYAKILRIRRPQPRAVLARRFATRRHALGAGPDRSEQLDVSEECALGQARLLYRKFWPEVALAKGWADNEMEVREAGVEVARE